VNLAKQSDQRIGAAHADARPAAFEKAGRTTVLVVDDQAVNRHLLKTLLGYQGHTVLEARDGDEALKITRATHPDVVISDIVMPNLDGFQFVNELRKDPRTASVTVVFYTGVFNETRARALARECGVDHLLVKPAEADEILKVVAAAVAESKHRAPKQAPAGFADEHGRLFSGVLSSKILELEREVLRRTEAEAVLQSALNGLEALVAQRTKELREANERLAAEAVTDALTGLYNRRLGDLAERELSRARRSGSKVAFVVVDVDHFKSINDRFGHEAGDRALQAISAVLRREIRHEDLAFRYGGEEFLLMLGCASASDIAPRLEQLRSAVAKEELRYGGLVLGRVTISIGVAIFPDHGATVEDVIRCADSAVYRAKESGRDRVVHFDGSVIGEGAA
jgi:diguanylate cyclase (GGDEF)-like protein